ncbi:ribulose bisphosphate carboxylase small subunit, partial [Dolichospermum sp. ST_sed10]|nr:ribulose bisphosphate carboxylase small subunit [Dolichospermum sp. ST_sed10]
FEEDGLSQRGIEQLVDTFPHQSIDFFSALRSRIYDEQIRSFIHQIGFENVSLRVVNSLEGPPAFKKPDFTLSHLIESGKFMVSEQKRVETSHLVDEYNRLNRGKGYQETSPIAEVSVSKPVINQPTHLSLETQAQVRQILAQGCKIALEHVDERRFRTGSWQSCGAFNIDAHSDAISTLESCLSEYSGEYVRLVGIDPQAKRRVVETIIQRPNGK